MEHGVPQGWGELGKLSAGSDSLGFPWPPTPLRHPKLFLLLLRVPIALRLASVVSQCPTGLFHHQVPADPSSPPSPHRELRPTTYLAFSYVRPGFHLVSIASLDGYCCLCIIFIRILQFSFQLRLTHNDFVILLKTDIISPLLLLKGSMLNS